jgi:thioredoxin reductase (NADPH)
MREQAKKCGATFSSDQVIRVDFSGPIHKLYTEGGATYQTKAVIIATGAQAKKLGCKGEQEYWGKGVTTCATCDAPFYEGKQVVVIGGGDTAMTEAEHLTHFARKITIIHRSDKLAATDPIKDKVLAHPNVTFLYNHTVNEIYGTDFKVTGVTIENKITKEFINLSCDGVFVTIGMKPATELFKGHLEMDLHGYLILSGKTATSKKGVFAAGDVADYQYQQAITAAGTGCMAALDAAHYLNEKI